jgi:NurA domain-containing protein
MGYAARYGKRPFEFASKSAHGHVIKDAAVQEFLKHCELPKASTAVSIPDYLCMPITPSEHDPIRHIIAIDGGFNEVAVRSEFPSATICFFQFGALIFDVADLDSLTIQPFIDPDDIQKLKRIQRIKLTLPVRNVITEGDKTLIDSVRRTVYKFFMEDVDEGRLIETLKWLIFEEFDARLDSWTLASCPVCAEPKVQLYKKALSKEFTFKCTSCKSNIYITDVFRLHEAIDNELGAGGILSYVVTAIEQIILAHLVRTILSTKPGLLNEVLFVKDGPLAFFGQTANMHKPFRALVNFLHTHHNFFLAGLEKSGAFVEHAHEISTLLLPGTALLLDDDYIYKYIIPGTADASSPYGRTTYYGNKVIFKSGTQHIHVATLPTREALSKPAFTDFPNISVVLGNIAKLRCDMYDDSLVPVALVNKLVSLANHPSSRILQKFAKQSVGGNIPA